VRMHYTFRLTSNLKVKKKAEKQFSAFFKKLKIIEFLYLQTPGVVDVTPALLAIQLFE